MNNYRIFVFVFLISSLFSSDFVSASPCWRSLINCIFCGCFKKAKKENDIVTESDGTTTEDDDSSSDLLHLKPFIMNTSQDNSEITPNFTSETESETESDGTTETDSSSTKSDGTTTDESSTDSESDSGSDFQKKKVIKKKKPVKASTFKVFKNPQPTKAKRKKTKKPPSSKSSSGYKSKESDKKPKTPVKKRVRNVIEKKSTPKNKRTMMQLYSPESQRMVDNIKRMNGFLDKSL